MALAPEHLVDLQNSGLSDATIAALGFHSVRPADLPIKAAQSAYKIPYHDLNGNLNCFYRLKLIPPVQDADGHTMKYFQEPGSRPQLYIPPIVSWRQVSRTRSIPVTITEGEKKAACACQCGLVAAGVGGVWNWTSTIGSGDKLILPILDEFEWTDRPVLLCPDSDAWHEGKEHTILGGFFALGKELQQRGAAVRFVRLPDLHGSKAGLDDWLIVPGNDVAQSWEKLERLPLDDARFSALAAWYRRWKDKQITQASFSQHDFEALDLSETAGLFTVRSAKHSVLVTFDRLHDNRGSVSAEVTVQVGATVLIEAVDLNLKSDSAHVKLASSLKMYSTTIPWKPLLQKSCALVLRRYRRGEPPAHLTKDTPVEPLTFAINPLVPRRKPCILFADGGKGKSTFALLLGMIVSTGATVAGLSALKGRALYLDWEDDKDVHTRRLRAIQAGHPDLIDAEVQYLRCAEPLCKLTHDLVRTIQQEGITFVVVDSLLAAAGGDASAEATGKLFAALRVLNVESLCIGHVPKTPMEGQEHVTVYGSVFNQNYARSVWELKTEQEIGEDGAILGLFHRKTNLTWKNHAFGLKVTHNREGASIRYDPFDLSQAAELTNALPLPNRIRTLLDDGDPRTAKEIADELAANLGSVKTTLSNPRYKGLKWQMLGEGKATKWTVWNR